MLEGSTEPKLDTSLFHFPREKFVWYMHVMKFSLLESPLAFFGFTAFQIGVALAGGLSAPSLAHAQSVPSAASVNPAPVAPAASPAPTNPAPVPVAPTVGPAPNPAPTAPAASPAPNPTPGDPTPSPASQVPPVAAPPSEVNTAASTPPAVTSPAVAPTGSGETLTDPAVSDAARQTVPSRAARPFAIWGSMGWNSIAGFAFGASYSFTPHLTADAAIGLSAIGPKTGARLRYNLLKSNWTPSFGLGIQYGPGSDEQITVQGQNNSIDPNDEDADAVVTIEPSAFVQALAAMTYQGAGGFNALFGLGYSILLDEDNVRSHSGGERTTDIVRLVAGSGIVLEVALGYAF